MFNDKIDCSNSTQNEFMRDIERSKEVCLNKNTLRTVLKKLTLTIIALTDLQKLKMHVEDKTSTWKISCKLIYIDFKYELISHNKNF